jgi:hypothetical protein
MVAEEKERVILGLESGTLVKCALCDEVGSSLALHVRKIHNIDKKEYVKIHGPVLASASREKYSKAAEDNGNWITKAKERGEDLTEYWKKVSDGVRSAIINSPEERERRSKMLASLNKTDAFRKRASDTAKITSARIDIQQNRSGQLKRWRDNNPKKFAAISEKLFSVKRKSKPEMAIDRWLIENYEGIFKYSQFFYSKTFKTVSSKKQVDFLSSDKIIVIEVDGPLHFKQSFDQFGKIREKDIALSIYSIVNQKSLIRISFDCWAQSTGNFSQSTLDKTKELIDNPIPGVHFIGKSWNGSDYTHATTKEEILKIYGA